jgi:hypothetical protein
VALAGALALATATETHAAIVYITPTDVGSSSQFSGFSIADYTISGAGLSPAGGPGEADDTHDNDGGASTMWLSQNDFTKGNEYDEYLIFDLGSVMDIDQALIWNHNQSGFTRLGVDTMTVSATATGTSVGDASGWAGDTVISLNEASGVSGETAQTAGLSFEGVRFIRFTDFDNFSTTGESYAGTVGLSEVRFVTLPEPSSTALLGLGGLALVLRRKRS